MIQRSAGDLANVPDCFQDCPSHTWVTMVALLKSPENRDLTFAPFGHVTIFVFTIWAVHQCT